jgi:hypothetical protein
MDGSGLRARAMHLALVGLAEILPGCARKAPPVHEEPVPKPEAVQLEAPAVAHADGEERRPVWSRPLFCVDGEGTGVLNKGVICGPTRSSCEASFDRHLESFDEFAISDSYTGCVAVDEGYRAVYCFDEPSGPTCTLKQLYCEMLSQGRPCAAYRLQ